MEKRYVYCVKCNYEVNEDDLREQETDHFTCIKCGGFLFYISRDKING